MPKVLIAEDDFIVADMLGDYLDSVGYEVCGLARTVEQAVELANLHQPDIGVFDFRLARGGYGSQIRPLLKEKNHISILFVSGDPLEHKMTRGDADAYIQKPYAMKDMVQSLEIIAGLKSVHPISPDLYPKCFHLFPDTGGEYRKVA